MALLAVLAAGVAAPALADPCKAIPDRGPLPPELATGRAFSGRVTHVIDGDGLCVAAPWDPRAWIEVRLADFYAPELAEPGGEAAKRALSRLTFGRELACRAQHRSYDRIVAACRLNGQPLGGLLRRAGVAEGGRGRP